METTATEPLAVSRTGEEISPTPHNIIHKPNDDSTATVEEILSIDCIDSSGANTQPKKLSSHPSVIEKDEGIVGLTPPKFHVEGAGEGDSRVTVPVGGITATTGATGIVRTVLEATTIPVSSNGNVSIHASLSQNSDEMPLSLASWYSEPGCTNSPLRSCCTREDNLSSLTVALSPVGGGRSSDEKENKTPPPNFISREAKSDAAISNRSLKNSRPTMQDSGQRKGRLDKKSGVNEVERERSKSVGNRSENCTEIGSSGIHERIECPRCSRKSKSGTVTPANPSRTPKRQIPSSKKAIQSLKRPIKSILKSDRGSSGSEKQSSMDSLGSSSGVSPVVMTRSDAGPRAKFFEEEGNKDYSSSSLRRAERYATVRLRKNRVQPVESERIEAARRKLSFEDIESMGGPGSIPGLMTKSMSYLEKEVPNGTSGSTSSATGLKRHGSLRVRKPSPGWEPCTTRTTALRLQKMQEIKARAGNQFAEKGSGELINMNTNQLSLTLPPRGSSDKKPLSKVFSKLSSASGQTASSSQKRLRQERGVQTESILVMKMAMNGRSSSAQGSSRSPTPISPTPISEDAQELMSAGEEIKHLQMSVKRYKAEAIKYQYVYEAAELEKTDLENHVRELKVESKDMINFLQDEKALLAESLAEAEAEIKQLRRQVEGMEKETESRCSSLVRLSEQHKQEALKSHALLKRLETDSIAVLGLKNNQLAVGALGIIGMKKQIVSLSDLLLKKYKVSQDLLTSALANSGSVNLLDATTNMKGSLLLPLITILSSAFETAIKNSVDAPGRSTNSSGKTMASTSTNGETRSVCPANSSISGAQRRSHGSLEDLKLAISEREEAERSVSKPLSSDESHDVLSTEINELNYALRQFVAVIQSVVIHCDRTVSNIATNILEVLKSADTESVAGAEQAK